MSSTSTFQFGPQVLEFLKKVHVERAAQIIDDACPTNAAYILPFSRHENSILKKYLRDQKEKPSAIETRRIFEPEKVQERLVHIEFESDTRSSIYHLPTREAELVRRLLDNIEILSGDNILVEILTALTPFQGPFSSIIEKSTEEPLSTSLERRGFVELPSPTSSTSTLESDSLNTAPTSPAPHPTPEPAPLLGPLPLLPLPPTPHHGPWIPELFVKNPHISEWTTEKYPIKAGAPYITGSIDDFIRAFKTDKASYKFQIGIVRKQLKDFEKDLEWFRNKAKELKTEQDDNSRQLRKGSGIHDVEYTRLHWAYLNISHLIRLIKLLEEILIRHKCALWLNLNSDLGEENLKKAVIEELGWQGEELPVPFKLSPWL